jgi:hypothetical protein
MGPPYFARFWAVSGTGPLVTSVVVTLAAVPALVAEVAVVPEVVVEVVVEFEPLFTEPLTLVVSDGVVVLLSCDGVGWESEACGIWAIATPPIRADAAATVTRYLSFMVFTP